MAKAAQPTSTLTGTPTLKKQTSRTFAAKPPIPHAPARKRSDPRPTQTMFQEVGLASPAPSPAPQPKTDIAALIASSRGIIPANVEYALLTYISEGHFDEHTILDIITAYQCGNLAGARILVDGLDGTIDGRFGELMLQGADGVARPQPARPKPEVE